MTDIMNRGIITEAECQFIIRHIVSNAPAPATPPVPPELAEAGPLAEALQLEFSAMSAIYAGDFEEFVGTDVDAPEIPQLQCCRIVCRGAPKVSLQVVCKYDVYCTAFWCR